MTRREAYYALTDLQLRQAWVDLIELRREKMRRDGLRLVAVDWADGFVRLHFSDEGPAR